MTHCYEQSSGVFRSAFELWQASVVRVEAGVVEMRQPLEPDYRPLREQLNQSGHFSLLALLQHGSLEPGGLPRVLLEAERPSRVRLERLQALGLIEDDPDHTGLRVRPEAQRFVRETLHAVNLL